MFLLVLVLLLLAGGAVWVRRAASGRGMHAGRDTVTFDEDGVRRHLPDGSEEAIRWADLAEVEIVTTSDGPWSDDVYWLLMSADLTQGCRVSSEAEGMQALLARLQQLPGFDNEAVIRAMGSTADARFRAWRRP